MKTCNLLKEIGFLGWSESRVDDLLQKIMPNLDPNIEQEIQTTLEDKYPHEQFGSWVYKHNKKSGSVRTVLKAFSAGVRCAEDHFVFLFREVARLYGEKLVRLCLCHIRNKVHYGVTLPEWMISEAINQCAEVLGKNGQLSSSLQIFCSPFSCFFFSKGKSRRWLLFLRQWLIKLKFCTCFILFNLKTPRLNQCNASK